MAASKPPKHDFAPAWLKIPNQESNKPDRSARSVGGEHRGRRDDHYRYPDYHNYPLPRQRSFDSYEDHPRPYAHLSHRHSSFEDDYHASRAAAVAAAAAYYNGYPDPDHPHGGAPPPPPPHQDRSHPLLHRSGSRDARDGKYPHHPAHRYPHSQMNGHGYPPGPGYYDYPSYGGPHHAGGPAPGPYRDYYNGYGPHPGRHRSDRHHSGSAGSGSGGGSDYDRAKEAVTKKDSASSRDEEKVVVKDEEFPSLNGDADTAEKTQRDALGKSGNNAWETPPKVQSKSSKSEVSSSPDLQRKDAEKASNSIYKALVPSKSVNARKSGRDGSKLTSSTSSSNKTLTNGKLSTMTNTGSQAKNNAREPAPRISPTPPPPAPAEILLSKRLITQPKNIGDKKSEFLRTLKKASPSRPQDINSNVSTQDDGGNGNDVTTSSSNDVTRSGNHHPATSNSIPTDASSAMSVDHSVEAMDRLSVDSNDCLSSSLEAEQRLLKEMGWKELDEEEEEYVITEADKKAVESQMRQCPRNGVVVGKPGGCTTPGAGSTMQLKSWSPRHLAPAFPPLATDDLNVLSSSEYSDSDSD